MKRNFDRIEKTMLQSEELLTVVRNPNSTRAGDTRLETDSDHENQNLTVLKLANVQQVLEHMFFAKSSMFSQFLIEHYRESVLPCK